jgi:hypothetical protein
MTLTIDMPEVQAWLERGRKDYRPFTEEQKSKLWVLLAPLREELRAERGNNVIPIGRKTVQPQISEVAA